MRRVIPILGLALALIAVGTVRSSDARVSANINLTFGRPAPFVVLDREPDVVVVPGTSVYYTDDAPYDLYRFGRYWYACDDGVWYRARSYRGPFVSVDFDLVPRTVLSCAPGGSVFRTWGGGWYRRDGYGGWDGDRVMYRGRDWDRERGVYRGDWNRGDRDRGDWNRGDRDRGDWNRGDRGDRGDRDDRGDRGRDRDRGEHRGWQDGHDRGRHGGQGDGDDD